MLELLLSKDIQYYLHLLILLILVWFKRKDFWNAVTGGDGNFDAIDLIKFIWIVLFPIVVLADLFLHESISAEAWITLDAIFFGLIGRDYGVDYLKYKREKQNHHKLVN